MTFFLSVFSLSFAGLVTIGLYFVQNSTQNLVLSCIFEALTSLAISLVFCVLVDLFPTNLRYVKRHIATYTYKNLKTSRVPKYWYRDLKINVNMGMHPYNHSVKP